MNRPPASALVTKPGTLPPADVRSVIAKIVSVQESLQAVMAGLTTLAAGTDEEARRLAVEVNEVARAQKGLADSHHQADERLNALIAVVDDLVRVRKAQV